MATSGSPDLTLFVVTLALLSIGVVMVFSASSVRAYEYYRDSYYFLKRQLLWSVVGVIAMMIAMRIDYRRLKELATPILVVSIALLVIVLIPGVGILISGSRRWLGVRNVFTFQPSEVAKLAMIIFLSAHLSRNPGEVRSLLRGIVPVLALLGLVFGLIMLEPDLGTAVSIVGVTFIMLFAAGASMYHLIGLVILGMPLFIAAVFAEEYRKRRFLAFLNPWADPLGSGFHIIQSLLALGSGGLFGFGLGRSRQKFLYLPEQHTDFIFAVLGEELGFVGAATVVFLFFLFALRGFRIALSTQDPFASLLASGITSMVIFQAVINIGVVSGILPITGIPLPLVSFGGSSLVVTLASIGLLLNISKHVRGRL
ncbi:MAG TPA: stage V sporulation protein E [Firmicutes bacterium]|nr:stage V sporulation protein E [Bacillota bacterium]